jgi:superfamily II DNA or RNA helicase
LGLPRGCLDETLDLFQSLQVKVKLTDQRFAGIPVELQFHGVLRAEQQQAADALLQHETGVLSASTAFGKTVVAAYLMAQRQVNTLAIVHRRQLLDQWVEALSQFLGLAPKEIGQIGGGKHQPTEKIDVAMVQSLVRKGIVDDLVGKYGYLMVDECHHISAVSFEQVITLIVQDVIAAVRANRFPVLLTERREHLDLLASLLAQQIQNVIVMSGGMGKKQRK